MKLSRRLKKFWAILCVMTLVVTSVTEYQNTINADEPNISVETEDWKKAEENKYPWENLGAYMYYVGNFGSDRATASYKGGEQLNNFAFRIDSNIGYRPHLVRLKTKEFATEEGKDYRYIVKFNSNKAGSVLKTKIDENTKLEDYTLVKGSNEIEVDFTANSQSSKIYLEMGALEVGTELEFIKVEIVEKKEINTLEITDITEQTYTGKKIEPDVIIKDDDTVLKLGMDYSLSYANNMNAGSAKVTITGKGNYTGTKTLTFTINPKSIANLGVSEIGTMEYTGTEIKPTLSIKDGKLSLKNDKDYTLKYMNNTKVGTATVVINGKGNYKGEKKVTFKIQKTIKLTVKEGKKTYVYTLGTKSSYKLPTNNKQLANQFPKLIKKGRVFKGFYKNGKKITKISNSTEVTLNVGNYRHLKTGVNQMILNKGIISFKFNKKDWAQLDGVEITWAKNSKFQGKSKKKKTIQTKGKKIPKLKYVIKKSKRYFKSGESYYFRIRYFYKVKNKKYYYQRESRKSIVYGKRLVVRK